MSMSDRTRVGPLALLLLALAAQAGDRQGPPPPDTPYLGRPVEPAELDRLSITVFPDGHGLPSGQGSVRDGGRLYAERCAACHGVTGIEGPAARLVGSDGWFAWNDPLRVLRIRRQPLQLISVTGMWPHATSIFDYLRRAMPHPAPKSLSDDEAYALTAYLLHLGGLLSAGAALDRESLPKVMMPGLARGVSAWPEFGATGAAGTRPHGSEVPLGANLGSK